MAHHVDARYDGRDSMFLPPLRTVGFNPQLKMNDSLLAQSYVEAYDISYPEAIDRLAKEVAEIRQCLENEGKFELNNIGTIYLNEDGNYTFEPCEAGILTPNLYGLGGFDMLPLNALATEKGQVVESYQQEANEQVGKQAIASKPMATTSQASNEEKTASILPLTGSANSIFDAENKEEESESAEFILIKKSWLRNLAAACIAIIAFFALSTPLRTPNVQSSKIDTGLLTRIMPKELEQVKADNKLQLSIKENNSNTLKLNEESAEGEQDKAELQNAKPYYSIVLASRVTKRNAANYVEELQSKGLKEAKVVITATNVKVVYGAYDTESQAHKALQNLRRNEIFADGWITKVTD